MPVPSCRPPVAALAGLLVSAVGCSWSDPNFAAVSGTVTLDGKPLAEALVVFEAADKRSSTGLTDGSGRYVMQFTASQDGAVVGKNTVRIATDRAGSTSPQVRKLTERVPDRYNIKSTETVEVKPGRNVFDFALTTP
jgi:hypothetical protein